MKVAITFVYPYFENAGMFRLQQETWNSYPPEIKDRIEFIVTDDCSVDNPARNNVLTGDLVRLNLSLYEIQNKVPWNWLAARNIGAHYARGKWLLLTDMDHLVSVKVVTELMQRLPELSGKYIYQFSRVKAPNNAPYKFHNDSFFITKKMFWLSGGYDESFSGLYGTSGMFRDRLLLTAKGRRKHFHDLALILYGREVMPDASTTCYARKEGRDPEAIRRVVRQKTKDSTGILLFQQPYKKVV